MGALHECHRGRLDEKGLTRNEPTPWGGDGAGDGNAGPDPHSTGPQWLPWCASPLPSRPAHTPRRMPRSSQPQPQPQSLPPSPCWRCLELRSFQYLCQVPR